MKLLFENWRKFINEQDDATVPAKPGAKRRLQPMNPADIKTPAPVQSVGAGKKKEIPDAQPSGETQLHNAEKLFDYYKIDPSIRTVFTEGWGGDFQVPSALAPDPAEKLINYMVANNPIFHNNKIVDYLGGGSFGFVMGLDNDHALKIFVGSFDPKGVDFGNWIDKEAKSDVMRYKGSQEKAFAGKGRAGDLMIYDQGKIKTPWSREVEEPVINPDTGEQEVDPDTGEGITKIVLHDTWHYAEMQMLRTLSRWMRYVHDNQTRTFTKAVDAEIDTLKKFANEVVNNIESVPPEEQGTFGIDSERPQHAETEYINKYIRYLDKTYAKNLLDQLKEILKTRDLEDIRDIRAVNIGVSMQDESLPIIFDY